MSFIEQQYLLELYDLIKNIFVYSHMKPYLRDKERQMYEYIFINAIRIIILILTLGVLFKTLIICLYFLLIQTLLNTIRFITKIPKTKCNIFICDTVKSIFLYFGKIFKKIYTYNFYEFQSILGGIFFVVIFCIYLFTNVLFMFIISDEIENEIKSKQFIIIHFLVFETNILLELICITFYNIRHINKQMRLVIGYFIFVNGSVMLMFYIKRLWINNDGFIEGDIPRRIMNLIFNVMFCLINIINFRNIAKYDVNSKLCFI